MEQKIIYPPIEFLFFDYEQPDDQAWSIIEALSDEWNETKKNKFASNEAGEISIIVKEGILDSEYPLLLSVIENLKKKYNLVWFVGIVDNRMGKAYENSPYIKIVGDHYPNEFIVNLSEAIHEPKPCAGCDNIDIQNEPIAAELIIDESFLDRQVDPLPHYKPPGLDLINLPNGAFLISKKIVDLLKEMKVSGYELIPVRSLATKKYSERIWLIKATRSITQPCTIHTPVTKEGICAVCGQILGGLLGKYHIREEWLNGDEFFTRNSNLFSLVYVSHRLYHAMKKEGAQGLLASHGIEKCSHIDK